MATNRLENFSDAAFAIAITLLVLELDVPTGDNLWHELADEWPSFAGYAVSFAIIAIIWINHHAVLDHLRRADRGVLVLNLLTPTSGAPPCASSPGTRSTRSPSGFRSSAPPWCSR